MGSLSPSGQAAREIVKRFPEASTRSLARMLVRTSPLLFTDFEHARGILRDVRGANGNRRRPFATSDPSPRSPLSTLLKQIPKGHTLGDASPFVIKGVKRLGIIGDIHSPYHSNEAVHAASEFLVKSKIDGLLINGDLIDNHHQSKFQKHPDARDFIEEIDITLELLELWRAMFPKARIFWKFGNHCLRHQKFLFEKCREIFGHSNFMLESLLELERLNIKPIKDDRTIMFGDLAINHGHEWGRTFGSPALVARWLFLRTLTHSVCNHFHVKSEYSDKDLLGNPIAAWSIPCLCDLSPPHARKSKWTHGFAVAELTSGKGSFRYEPHHISDTGKVY